MSSSSDSHLSWVLFCCSHSSVGLFFRCSCSLSASSSFRQSIHLAKPQKRRSSTPLPLVNWGQIGLSFLSFCWVDPFMANYIRVLSILFFYRASIFPLLLQSSPGPSAHCHLKAPTPSLTSSLKRMTFSWCRTQRWRTSNPSSRAGRIITLPTTRGWRSLTPKPESTATLRQTSPPRPKLKRCPQVPLGPCRKGLWMELWLMRSQDLKITG